LPAIYTTDNLDSLPNGPLVVKERYGAGSLGIRLNVSPSEARLAATSFSQPIFQPFVSGREFSLDAYVTMTHEVKGLVVRTRDLVEHGESQVTTTVDAPTLASLGLEIVRALGLYGHVVLQLLQDPEGQCHLIECNCRFGGASTLSLAAGLDSFYWFLLESEQEDLSTVPFLPSPKPLRQVRYPADMVTAW
jgi:carbamoyl-phosphate synthase large subunit